MSMLLGQTKGMSKETRSGTGSKSKANRNACSKLREGWVPVPDVLALCVNEAG